MEGMLNPLLYGFMSDWMRNHLKNMWHNYRCCNPHSAFRNRLNSKFFTSNTTVRFILSIPNITPNIQTKLLVDNKTVGLIGKQCISSTLQATTKKTSFVKSNALVPHSSNLLGLFYSSLIIQDDIPCPMECQTEAIFPFRKLIKSSSSISIYYKTKQATTSTNCTTATSRTTSTMLDNISQIQAAENVTINPHATD